MSILDELPQIPAENLPRPETIRAAVLALENTRPPPRHAGCYDITAYGWEAHRDRLVSRLYQELKRSSVYQELKRSSVYRKPIPQKRAIQLVEMYGEEAFK